MTAEKLLDHLEQVRRNGDGRWIACCPAHDDNSPSLSIRETGDGRVLVHCFAGCGAADVVGAAGLQLADLFPPDREHRRPIRARDRWVPRDVLRALADESLLVLIAAEQTGRGEALTAADLDRLATAQARIRAAARAGGLNV